MRLKNIQESSDSFTLADFLRNEDINAHTENAVQLANHFGDEDDKATMAKIERSHSERGHILPDEYAARNEIVKKLYPLLQKVEEAKYGKKKKYNEAGGYYTQPVYDMIEKYGYEKVMHELLTSLHADVIQDFLKRVEFDESINEASSEVHTVFINGKKWKSFYKKETADKAAATIAAKGKKTEVKSEPAPQYKPREYKAPEPKPQDPKRKAAMDKALASIDATFNPGRSKISDQVLAMARTAKMLQDPNWADRAWSNVEQYGIKNTKDLAQEIKLLMKNEKEVMDNDADQMIKGPDSNIKTLQRALDSLSKSEGITEQQVGQSKRNIENILLSMQYDINEKALLPQHKEELIQQHNEIMEIYEQLESGELTEERLDEVLPLAALAWSGARMAAGAALRSAAGQALKRGAIQGAKRVGRGVKNAFKRKSNRRRVDIDSPNRPTKSFAKDLGITGSDNDGLGAAGAAAGLDARDLQTLRNRGN